MANKQINYLVLPREMNYNMDTHTMADYEHVTNELYGSYLQNLYRGDVDKLRGYFDQFKTEEYKTDFLEKIKVFDKAGVHTLENIMDIEERIVHLFNNSDSLTYEECFNIKDDGIRIKFFEVINIEEMFKNLNPKRISVDGIESDNKIYDAEGNYLRTEKINNIYEVYECDTKPLGLDQPAYAVKCWCTSTSNEHWLWIKEEYKNDPLTAIASTFMIHENLIPYIDEIKRQGDVVFLELTDPNVKPDGKIVPLTKEQYFEKLTVQT